MELELGAKVPCLALGYFEPRHWGPGPSHRGPRLGRQGSRGLGTTIEEQSMGIKVLDQPREI